VEERLQRGERIPGFGQPLYPDGDPRAAILLELIESAYPGSTTVAAARAVAAEVEGLIGQRPTIDFALAALSLELGLGPGGAFTVFALGRTAASGEVVLADGGGPRPLPLAVRRSCDHATTGSMSPRRAYITQGRFAASCDVGRGR